MSDPKWTPANDRFEGNAEDFEFLPPPEADEPEPEDPEQAEAEFLKWVNELDK